MLHDDDGVTTFVDYIEPVSPNPPPPAKYKLWLIIMVLVFFAEWFAHEAGVTEALGRSGWLSPTAAMFFTLAIIVFVMVFATLDLVVTMFTITIKGHSYGLGPWLKQGRSVWIYQQKNFFAECLACVMKILEDGFCMFDAPPPVAAGFISEEEDKEFTCPSGDCNVVLKVEHRINPEKIKEYREWSYKIDKASTRYARGLVDVRKSQIVREDTFDEELGKATESSVSEETKSERLHTIYLTFESLEYLNEWMTSKKRQKLMNSLKPLLAAPDIVQIQNDRDLPDAFTDLLIRQGECVPSLTPKKWKVWWLTLLGLFFVLLWTGAVMPYYYAQWRLDSAHERLQGFVTVLITTFLSSYVMTPLLLFLFSTWVSRKETENDNRQPWKTLNDGFESIWAKAALTVALYGGFLVSWAVKVNT